MATNTLIMSYVLRKFKNARSSANNRWFAYGYYQEQSGKKAPMIPLAAAEEPEP